MNGRTTFASARWSGSAAMRGLPSVLIGILAAAGASAAAVAADGFAILPAPQLATNCALTEDGSFLVIAHREVDQVSVWDVRNHAIVTIIDCAAPGCILARGAEIYVANEGKGTVSIYHEGTWKPDNVVQVGFPTARFLCAPQGAHFRNAILATAGPADEGATPGLSGTGAPRHLVLIDVAKDVSRELPLADGMRPIRVTASADGQWALVQVPVSAPQICRWDELIKGRNMVERSAATQVTDLLSQSVTGDFWTSCDGIYRGKELAQVSRDPRFNPSMPGEFRPVALRQTVVDATASALYAVYDDHVDAYSQRADLPKAGTWNTTRPDLDYPLTFDPTPWIGAVAPQAVTSDGTTHLFILGRRPGVILFADLPALIAPVVAAVTAPVPAGTPPAAPGTPASPADTPPAVAGPAPAGTDPAPGTDAASADFPSQAVVGTQVVHDLVPHGAAGTYTVINGPADVAVSPQGRVTWTPTSADIGMQAIKIRGECGGQIEFYRFICTVVSQAVAAVAVDAAAHAFAVLPTDVDVTTFALTEDGATLVLAHQGADRLTIWDVKTNTAAKTVSCIAPNWILSRGHRTYVADAGRGLVTVFDESTWAQVDQLKVSDPNPVFLSAPGGEHFANQLLVTANTGGNNRHVYLVDAKADTCHAVRDNQYYLGAMASHDGGTVLLYDDDRLGQRVSATWFTYDEFLKGTSSGSHLDRAHLPLLAQTWDGDIWIGGDGVYAGKQPDLLAFRESTETFPVLFDAQTAMDACDHVIYRATPKGVTMYGMEMALPIQGVWHTTMPEVPAPAPHYGEPSAHDRQFAASAQAVTIDGVTHLYLIGKEPGTVLAISLPRADLHDGADVASAPAASSPTPAGNAAGADGFPPVVVTGTPVTHSLLDHDASGEFAVLVGPKDLSVSAQGVVTWTPGDDEIGVQTVKIRGTVAGETEFYRFSTRVIDAKIAKRLGGDLSKAASIGRFAGDGQLAPVTFAADVLLRIGRALTVIDPDGLLGTTITLPGDYHFVRDREKYFIAVANDHVDLIDRKSLQITRTIPLGSHGTSAIAVVPNGAVSFISCDFSHGAQELEGMRIVAVDEAKGTATPVPKAYGNILAIHPGGHQLYAAIQDVTSDQTTFMTYFGDIFTLERYYDIDLLFAFDITGTSLHLRQANTSPGSKGRDLVVSPDGKLVSYVSGGGIVANNAPGFPCANIAKPTVEYPTGSFPTDLAFHPILPLAAGTNGTVITVFDEATGAVLADKLQQPDPPMSAINRVVFAPAGTCVLAVGMDAAGPCVRAVPLNLTPEERSRLDRTLPAPAALAAVVQAPAAAPAALVAQGDLDALNPGISLPEQNAAQIAKRYQDAVVLISTPDQAGSGFFVGRSGYVLTCAHVVPNGPFTVTWNGSDAARTAQHDDHPQVILTDDDLDLALVKIHPTKPVTTVRLERAVPDLGEHVFVIGNPVMGDLILTATMTDGLVSSPNRVLDGQGYVQTSAPINPGNSGGPVFDPKGGVIGMVEAKAVHQEATAFATPGPRLIEFLRRCAGKPGTTP